MKEIIVCGSMIHVKKMIEIERKLIRLGYNVVLPEFTKEYSEMKSLDNIKSESVKNKVNHNLIKKYFEKIKCGDYVLIVNEDKENINNYIGGNSFLEMGFAHVLGKKLYLLNNIPNVGYKDEIEAMKPIILNGNLNNIE